MGVNDVYKGKKLNRDDFLEQIRRASDEEYKTEWDDFGRVGEQKKKSKMEKGAKSKARGGQFELRVRKDLEEKGWIVDKWSNNLDLETKEIRAAKKKFNPFSKAMTIGTGFPDFVCFEKRGDLYKVIGVEVKMNGTLSLLEKNKCKLYLEKQIFNEILIAKKAKKIKKSNRVLIEYISFNEIEARMRK
ncbi:MAG: hypothetical protein IH845_01605 [Nanoarchaeota archaeon]|nr:hypothetical protein [Nanoarchaeota archaeon]